MGRGGKCCVEDEIQLTDLAVRQEIMQRLEQAFGLTHASQLGLGESISQPFAFDDWPNFHAWVVPSGEGDNHDSSVEIAAPRVGHNEDSVGEKPPVQQSFFAQIEGILGSIRRKVNSTSSRASASASDAASASSASASNPPSGISKQPVFLFVTAYAGAPQARLEVAMGTLNQLLAGPLLPLLWDGRVPFFDTSSRLHYEKRLRVGNDDEDDYCSSSTDDDEPITDGGTKKTPFEKNVLASLESTGRANLDSPADDEPLSNTVDYQQGMLVPRDWLGHPRHTAFHSIHLDVGQSLEWRGLVIRFLLDDEGRKSLKVEQGGTSIKSAAKI